MITVLVLDDEQAVRTSLSVFLQDEGFDVLAAASAEAALGVLQERTVDVAITDLRLLGMDGHAFIEAAHKVQPRARFLIHTGSLQYSPPAALQKLGIRPEHIFHKPIADMSLIAKAIRDLIEHNEPSRDEGE